MTILAIGFCVISSLAISDASVQDIYNQLPGGFLPSPVKYFKQSGDQLAMDSDSSSTSTSDRSQQARLGYPIYSGTSLNMADTNQNYGLWHENDMERAIAAYENGDMGLNAIGGGGYSATGTGVYSPLKLDLGGLLLGTVVGLGAVLIIPKLLHIFSYSANSPYSHYGRSEQGVTSELTEMASRVDRALAEYNVSASDCFQRALCSWQTTPADGEPSGVVAAISRNPLVSFLLEGSRLERAVELGRSGLGCAAAFPRCPVTGESLAASLSAVTNSVQT